MPWDRKVPFDQNGNLVEYPMDYDDYTWLEDPILQKTLIVDRVRRGQSSTKIILKDEQNREFAMFPMDLVEMLKCCICTDGRVTGRWGFHKKGADYGVYYAGE